MPPSRGLLTFTSLMAWVATLVTGVYYVSHIPIPSSLAENFVVGGRIMLAYNGVLSIILWLLCTRGLKSEDKIRVSFIHLLTGIVFVMLSLLLAPIQPGVVLVHRS